MREKSTVGNNVTYVIRTNDGRYYESTGRDGNGIWLTRFRFLAEKFEDIGVVNEATSRLYDEYKISDVVIVPVNNRRSLFRREFHPQFTNREANCNGQSAAKPRTEEGSTTIPNGSRLQA